MQMQIRRKCWHGLCLLARTCWLCVVHAPGAEQVGCMLAACWALHSSLLSAAPAHSRGSSLLTFLAAKEKKGGNLKSASTSPTCDWKQQAF